MSLQSDVVSRRQATSLGWSDGQVNSHVAAGLWRRLHHGVFVTHAGPLTWRVNLWAALLHAGTGAVASHRSAARLHGLLDCDPSTVELLVPWGHRVRARPGLVVRSSRLLDDRVHPSKSVPQTRVEHTVLDLVEQSSATEDVVSWVLVACQRRATTPERLAEAMNTRPRQRHRRLVLDVLSEAQNGVASLLERRYHRDVEVAHGLPPARRGDRVKVLGRTWYADARHDEYATRIELEGLRWHPSDARWRDDVRDNSAVIAGDVVLRFGWRAVAGDPCRVAAEVATVLRARGWTGEPRRCGPGCTIR